MVYLIMVPIGKCAKCGIARNKYNGYKTFFRNETRRRELEQILNKAVKEYDFLCNTCRLQLSKLWRTPMRASRLTQSNVSPSSPSNVSSTSSDAVDESVDESVTFDVSNNVNRA